jgi:hypothetical protein
MTNLCRTNGEICSTSLTQKDLERFPGRISSVSWPGQSSKHKGRGRHLKVSSHSGRHLVTLVHITSKEDEIQNRLHIPVPITKKTLLQCQLPLKEKPYFYLNSFLEAVAITFIQLQSLSSCLCKLYLEGNTSS